MGFNEGAIRDSTALFRIFRTSSSQLLVDTRIWKGHTSNDDKTVSGRAEGYVGNESTLFLIQWHQNFIRNHRLETLG